MKTYLLNIIPSLETYSRKLDDITNLTSQEWVLVDETTKDNVVFIFLNQHELIVAKNGVVQRSSWQYISSRSIILNIDGQGILFRHGFLDENLLALQVSGVDEYALLVNANEHDAGLRTIEKVDEYLKLKYSKPLPINSSSVSQATNTHTVYRRTTTGIDLVIISEGTQTIGARVISGGKAAPDGLYEYMEPSHFKIRVKDGKIIERFFMEIANGYLFTKSADGAPQKGDLVTYPNGVEIPDGQISYSWFKRYKVQNSRIVS